MNYKESGFYCADCMVEMEKYPDKYFDLAIVDPPYGLGDAVVNCVGRFKRYENKNGNWDKNTPNKKYFIELERISKQRIIWGGNYFELPPTKCFVIWDKLQPQDVTFASCEFGWTSFKSVAKTYYMRPQGQENRFHPTQKPVELYEWLLTNYAKEGDKILDTHAGSASSLIACDNLGFDCVGFEIDEDYFRMANERREAFKAQLRLY